MSKKISLDLQNVTKDLQEKNYKQLNKQETNYLLLLANTQEQKNLQLDQMQEPIEPTSFFGRFFFLECTLETLYLLLLAKLRNAKESKRHSI
jgi:hypothetical protein